MRGLVMGVALACAAWAPAWGQALLTPSEFRDAALAIIRAEAPNAEIDLRGDLGLIIRNPANTAMPEGTVNLDTGYAEYLRDPSALASIVDRWARFATQPPEASQRRDRVVAVLRSRAVLDGYVAAVAASAPQDPSPLVWRAFAGDLVEVLVFDGAETLQYATEASLAELGLEPAAAWALAPENLPSRLGPLQVGAVEGAGDLVYVTGGNGLAPSSLIDGRICSSQGAGDFVFLVVDRNGFVMADTGSPAARAQLMDLLKELQRTGASMSLTPLGCRDGRLDAASVVE